MTSTNDNKDVKNITEEPAEKGKIHIKEVTERLEILVQSNVPLGERCEALACYWRAATGARPSQPLLRSLHRNTLLLVLQEGWLRLEQSLRTALTTAVEGCAAALENVPPTAQRRLRVLLDTAADPWHRPLLRDLLQKPTPPDPHQVRVWVHEEGTAGAMERLRQLCSAGGTAAEAALRLARALLPPPPLPPLPPATRLAVDALLVLLVRAGRTTDCIREIKALDTREAVAVIGRLATRNKSSGRVWKHAEDTAKLCSQVLVAECLIRPLEGSSLGTLSAQLASLYTARPHLLAPALRKLLQTADSALHIYVVCRAVEHQFGDTIRAFVCELYVRALTTGMNELERHRLSAEPGVLAATAQQLSAWFLALADFLRADRHTAAECLLTAFSLHPTKDCYRRLQQASNDNAKTPAQADLDEIAAAAEALNQLRFLSMPPLPSLPSSCPSPATAASNHLQDPDAPRNSSLGPFKANNLVSSMETVEASAGLPQRLVSGAVLEEEGLDLEEDLRRDLAVLLSGPRLKMLTWDLSWSELSAHCLSYMEDTAEGTKTVTKELKYLHLDYSNYILQEPVEQDIYFGIEKGYEHHLEIEEEEVWEDFPPEPGQKVYKDEFHSIDSPVGSEGSDYKKKLKKVKKKKPITNTEEVKKPKKTKKKKPLPLEKSSSTESAPESELHFEKKLNVKSKTKRKILKGIETSPAYPKVPHNLNDAEKLALFKVQLQEEERKKQGTAATLPFRSVQPDIVSPKIPTPKPQTATPKPSFFRAQMENFETLKRKQLEMDLDFCKTSTSGASNVESRLKEPSLKTYENQAAKCNTGVGIQRSPTQDSSQYTVYNFDDGEMEKMRRDLLAQFNNNTTVRTYKAAPCHPNVSSMTKTQRSSLLSYRKHSTIKSNPRPPSDQHLIAAQGLTAVSASIQYPPLSNVPPFSSPSGSPQNSFFSSQEKHPVVEIAPIKTVIHQDPVPTVAHSYVMSKLRNILVSSDKQPIQVAAVNRGVLPLDQQQTTPIAAVSPSKGLSPLEQSRPLGKSAELVQNLSLPAQTQKDFNSSRQMNYSKLDNNRACRTGGSIPETRIEQRCEKATHNQNPPVVHEPPSNSIRSLSKPITEAQKILDAKSEAISTIVPKSNQEKHASIPMKTYSKTTQFCEVPIDKVLYYDKAVKAFTKVPVMEHSQNLTEVAKQQLQKPPVKGFTKQTSVQTQIKISNPKNLEVQTTSGRCHETASQRIPPILTEADQVLYRLNKSTAVTVAKVPSVIGDPVNSANNSLTSQLPSKSLDLRVSGQKYCKDVFKYVKSSSNAETKEVEVKIRAESDLSLQAPQTMQPHKVIEEQVSVESAYSKFLEDLQASVNAGSNVIQECQEPPPVKPDTPGPVDNQIIKSPLKMFRKPNIIKSPGNFSKEFCSPTMTVSKPDADTSMIKALDKPRSFKNSVPIQNRPVSHMEPIKVSKDLNSIFIQSQTLKDGQVIKILPQESHQKFNLDNKHLIIAGIAESKKDTKIPQTYARKIHSNILRKQYAIMEVAKPHILEQVASDDNKVPLRITPHSVSAEIKSKGIGLKGAASRHVKPFGTIQIPIGTSQGIKEKELTQALTRISGNTDLIVKPPLKSTSVSSDVKSLRIPIQAANGSPIPEINRGKSKAVKVDILAESIIGPKNRNPNPKARSKTPHAISKTNVEVDYSVPGGPSDNGTWTLQQWGLRHTKNLEPEVKITHQPLPSFSSIRKGCSVPSLQTSGVISSQINSSDFLPDLYTSLENAKFNISTQRNALKTDAGFADGAGECSNSHKQISININKPCDRSDVGGKLRNENIKDHHSSTNVPLSRESSYKSNANAITPVLDDAISLNNDIPEPVVVDKCDITPLESPHCDVPSDKPEEVESRKRALQIDTGPTGIFKDLLAVREHLTDLKITMSQVCKMPDPIVADEIEQTKPSVEVNFSKAVEMDSSNIVETITNKLFYERNSELFNFEISGDEITSDMDSLNEPTKKDLSDEIFTPISKVSLGTLLTKVDEVQLPESDFAKEVVDDLPKALEMNSSKEIEKPVTQTLDKDVPKTVGLELSHKIEISIPTTVRCKLLHIRKKTVSKTVENLPITIKELSQKIDKNQPKFIKIEISKKIQKITSQNHKGNDVPQICQTNLSIKIDTTVPKTDNDVPKTKDEDVPQIHQTDLSTKIDKTVPISDNKDVPNTVKMDLPTSIEKAVPKTTDEDVPKNFEITKIEKAVPKTINEDVPEIATTVELKSDNITIVDEKLLQADLLKEIKNIANKTVDKDLSKTVKLDTPKAVIKNSPSLETGGSGMDKNSSPQLSTYKKVNLEKTVKPVSNNKTVFIKSSNMNKSKQNVGAKNLPIPVKSSVFFKRNCIVNIPIKKVGMQCRTKRNHPVLPRSISVKAFNKPSPKEAQIDPNVIDLVSDEDDVVELVVPKDPFRLKPTFKKTKRKMIRKKVFPERITYLPSFITVVNSVTKENKNPPKPVKRQSKKAQQEKTPILIYIIPNDGSRILKISELKMEQQERLKLGCSVMLENSDIKQLQKSLKRKDVIDLQADVDINSQSSDSMIVDHSLNSTLPPSKKSKPEIITKRKTRSHSKSEIRSQQLSKCNEQTCSKEKEVSEKEKLQSNIKEEFDTAKEDWESNDSNKLDMNSNKKNVVETNDDKKTSNDSDGGKTEDHIAPGSVNDSEDDVINSVSFISTFEKFVNTGKVDQMVTNVDPMDVPKDSDDKIVNIDFKVQSMDIEISKLPEDYTAEECTTCISDEINEEAGEANEKSTEEPDKTNGDSTPFPIVPSPEISFNCPTKTYRKLQTAAKKRKSDSKSSNSKKIACRVSRIDLPKEISAKVVAKNSEMFDPEMFDSTLTVNNILVRELQAPPLVLTNNDSSNSSDSVCLQFNSNDFLYDSGENSAEVQCNNGRELFYSPIFTENRKETQETCDSGTSFDEFIINNDTNVNTDSGNSNSIQNGISTISDANKSSNVEERCKEQDKTELNNVDNKVNLKQSETRDSQEKEVFGDGSGRRFSGGPLRHRGPPAALSDSCPTPSVRRSTRNQENIIHSHLVKFLENHNSSNKKHMRKKISPFAERNLQSILSRSDLNVMEIANFRCQKESKESVFSRVPGLRDFNYIVPRIMETVVNVVQLGQLPVSSAQQSPLPGTPTRPPTASTEFLDITSNNSGGYTSPAQEDSRQSGSHEIPDLKDELPDLKDNIIDTIKSEDTTDDSSAVGDQVTENNMEDTTLKDFIMGTIKKEEVLENLETPPESITDQISISSETNTQCATQIHTSQLNSIPTSGYTTSDGQMQLIFTSPITSQVNFVSSNAQEDQKDLKAAPENAANSVPTSNANFSNMSRAQALVNILSQKILQPPVSSGQQQQVQMTTFPKGTPINALSLQQALAQILPPPLSQASDSSTVAHSSGHQVVHIMQGKNTGQTQGAFSGLLVDSSQQSLNTPGQAQVLHFVQGKNTTNQGNSTILNQSLPAGTTFGGLSLVEAGSQQQGNQVLHIVNTGNQSKNNATAQLLKRVNLLTSITNSQGNNEQKMVQFVCKSADGKAIQLSSQHQRGMVLRLQPIENSASTLKPAESPSTLPQSGVKKSPQSESQQEIKSRSIYEENYAKFIQNSSNKLSPISPEKSTSLPKFNQAFGKSVFQDNNGVPKIEGEGSPNTAVTTVSEQQQQPSQDVTSAINLAQMGQLSSPPLLIRKTSQPGTAHSGNVQQVKQSIGPMNIQTMHGGVIYTRQIPVNISGGQTINLITVPTTDLLDEAQIQAIQKQAQDKVNMGEQQPDQQVLKIVQDQQQQQSNICHNIDSASDDANQGFSEQQSSVNTHPLLTQMRIKVPMLSKGGTQVVTGTRVVRPVLQIQRSVIPGTNQSVYQQLVLTTAPPLRAPTPAPARPPRPQTTPHQESNLSSSTLEQLREFDMVLEQVKERSTVQPGSNSNSAFSEASPQRQSLENSTDNAVSSQPPVTQNNTQREVLYSIGPNQTVNVTYVNKNILPSNQTVLSSSYGHNNETTTIVNMGQQNTPMQVPHGLVNTANHPKPGSSTPTKTSSKSMKSKPSKPPNVTASTSSKASPVAAKTSLQKPLEDEQTTQRILYILAEYKEQVENSPDKDKPAPRRRSNPPTNPSTSSKRKKGSGGSKKGGNGQNLQEMSPLGEDGGHTMGSEDSSCGLSQGDCADNSTQGPECQSPHGSPQKAARKLVFQPDPECVPVNPSITTQPQQRNVIIADGQTIAMTRPGPGGKATTVLMPANYLLPMSMVKGGQQITIVTNQGPKILSVPHGEGGATNTLFLQRLISPAGLKPMLARPGQVRQVRLPANAVQNLQAFNLATPHLTTQDGTSWIGGNTFNTQQAKFVVDLSQSGGNVASDSNLDSIKSEPSESLSLKEENLSVGESTPRQDSREGSTEDLNKTGRSTDEGIFTGHNDSTTEDSNTPGSTPSTAQQILHQIQVSKAMTNHTVNLIQVHSLNSGEPGKLYVQNSASLGSLIQLAGKANSGQTFQTLNLQNLTQEIKTETQDCVQNVQNVMLVRKQFDGQFSLGTEATGMDDDIGHIKSELPSDSMPSADGASSPSNIQGYGLSQGPMDEDSMNKTNRSGNSDVPWNSNGGGAGAHAGNVSPAYGAYGDSPPSLSHQNDHPESDMPEQAEAEREGGGSHLYHKMFITSYNKKTFTSETSPLHDKQFAQHMKKDGHSSSGTSNTSGEGRRGTARGSHTAASLRHKYAVMEHELRLQKSLSEECEDLGVDSPSASDLFPEAELLFAASPASQFEQSQDAAPPVPSSAPVPPAPPESDFARMHPNTTFHSGEIELDEVEDTAINMSFRGASSKRTNATSRSQPVRRNEVIRSVIEGVGSSGSNFTSSKMTTHFSMVGMPCRPSTNIMLQSSDDALSEAEDSMNSAESKDGLVNNKRLDGLLTTDVNRDVNLAEVNRESSHPRNVAQVIRHASAEQLALNKEGSDKICEENSPNLAQNGRSFLLESSNDTRPGDSMMLKSIMLEQDRRDNLTCSSPEQHSELFWESNSNSNQSEEPLPHAPTGLLDFSSEDSNKCCKSPPSCEETNSTDSSSLGGHNTEPHHKSHPLRLNSVIKTSGNNSSAAGGPILHSALTGSIPNATANDSRKSVGSLHKSDSNTSTSPESEARRVWGPGPRGAGGRRVLSPRSLSAEINMGAEIETSSSEGVSVLNKPAGMAVHSGSSTPEEGPLAARRASLRGPGGVKRSCHCCVGQPAPPPGPAARRARRRLPPPLH